MTCIFAQSQPSTFWNKQKHRNGPVVLNTETIRYLHSVWTNCTTGIFYPFNLVFSKIMCIWLIEVHFFVNKVLCAKFGSMQLYRTIIWPERSFRNDLGRREILQTRDPEWHKHLRISSPPIKFRWKYGWGSPTFGCSHAFPVVLRRVYCTEAMYHRLWFCHSMLLCPCFVFTCWITPFPCAFYVLYCMQLERWTESFGYGFDWFVKTLSHILFNFG